jgi:Spy/CpxP family protein refolding chaperone
MKKSKFLFLFIFLLAFIFTGTYFAGKASAFQGMQKHNFMGHKFMRRGKMNMWMKIGMFNVLMLKKKLHLNKKQVHQIMLFKRQEFKAFKSNMENFRNPLLSAMKSGMFNKSVFVANITNKIKNMAEIKANFFQKFFNVLTPKQRNKFVQMMKKRIANKIKRLEFMKKMLNKKINAMKENLSE